MIPSVNCGPCKSDPTTVDDKIDDETDDVIDRTSIELQTTRKKEMDEKEGIVWIIFICIIVSYFSVLTLKFGKMLLCLILNFSMITWSITFRCVMYVVFKAKKSFKTKVDSVNSVCPFVVSKAAKNILWTFNFLCFIVLLRIKHFLRYLWAQHCHKILLIAYFMYNENYGTWY